MKIYKTCLSILVACILLLACFNFNFVASAENTSKKIDMYLIGGQSNAAGYSAKGTLNETFSNIGYAGEVDRSADGSVKQSFISNYADYKWSITAGLGRTQNHIGPEYGMAKELNSLYAGENKAFIFKTATGSTSLRDITANQWGGNWYPRSLWQDGYTPNVNTFEPRTGVIYKRFIDNFKTVYNNLVAQGYTPVVRGMVWMQGEEDLGYESQYKTLLKTFITDIRSDLTTFTGDDLTEMPFVIGKIATTFAKYNNSSVPAFNAVQQEVADEMVNVKTVETSDLIIVDSNGSVKGTDPYHFSGSDALTLGRRFAKKLLEMSKQNLVSFKGNNAQFSYIEKADGSLQISVKPYSGFTITRVMVNGVDITKDLVDGKYVISNPTKNTDVEVFTRGSSICTIEYADVENARFLYWYENVEKNVGEKLKVKIRTDEGYVVDAVYCNGIAMEYNESSDVYEIIINEDSVITANIKKASDVNLPVDNNSDSSNPSCFATIGADGAGACLTTLMFAGVMLLIKRSKKV